MAVERQDRREAVLIHLTPEVKQALSRIADDNGRSRKREIERLLARHANRLSQDAGQGAGHSAVGTR